MKLAVSDIREDPTLQLRGELDMDRVQAMIEFEEQGGQLPPITVVGPENILGDGHHRLYAAMTSGKRELDANRIEGGLAEAVVAAIVNNDTGTHKPLTRTERNKGIKLLFESGWTQHAIADATGVHQTTITNIGNSLAMRGLVTKKVGGKGTPKAVAVLPSAVADKLNDTTLVRIADTVPVEQQVEFATAVADAELSEPRVRDAIKELKDGLSPTEAVQAVAPVTIPKPTSLAEAARQARRRIDTFAATTMVVDGQPRDLWAVLDVLVAHQDTIPMEARGLSEALAELMVKADYYATRLAPELLAVEA